MVYLARMGLRDFAGATDAMVRALELQPGNAYYRRLLALAFKDNGDDRAALPLLDGLLADQPDDFALLDAMVVCRHRLGDSAGAAVCGQRKLDLLDDAVANVAPDQLPAPKGFRNVVSFSLWGAENRYCVGAIANAATIGERLPGWIARFYLGPAVPAAVAARLKTLDAEVVPDAPKFQKIPLMMRRFVVHDDPAVDRYLSRDCDSRIGTRETAAIAEWVDSGQPFHILRDHPFHHELVHGGLWGGRANRLFAIGPLIAAYQDRHRGEQRYGNDQRFLGEQIYPRIRSHATTHDSHYRLANSRPVPGGRAGDDADHIGMGIVGAERLRVEAAALAR